MAHEQEQQDLRHDARNALAALPDSYRRPLRPSATSSTRRRASASGEGSSRRSGISTTSSRAERRPSTPSRSASRRSVCHSACCRRSARSRTAVRGGWYDHEDSRRGRPRAARAQPRSTPSRSQGSPQRPLVRHRCRGCPGRRAGGPSPTWFFSISSSGRPGHARVPRPPSCPRRGPRAASSPAPPTSARSPRPSRPAPSATSARPSRSTCCCEAAETCGPRRRGHARRSAVTTLLSELRRRRAGRRGGTRRPFDRLTSREREVLQGPLPTAQSRDRDRRAVLRLRGNGADAGASDPCEAAGRVAAGGGCARAPSRLVRGRGVGTPLPVLRRDAPMPAPDGRASPYSSPHICFSNGMITSPPSESFAQKSRSSRRRHR